MLGQCKVISRARNPFPGQAELIQPRSKRVAYNKPSFYCDNSKDQGRGRSTAEKTSRFVRESHVLRACCPCSSFLACFSCFPQTTQHLWGPGSTDKRWNTSPRFPPSSPSSLTPFEPHRGGANRTERMKWAQRERERDLALQPRPHGQHEGKGRWLFVQ